MITALLLTATIATGLETPITIQTTPNPNRRICRTQERPASRMSAERVCKTAAEWEAERLAAQRYVQGRQNLYDETQQRRTPSGGN